MAIKKLAPQHLNKIIDLKELPFKDTKSLPHLDSIIGQERAIEALTFGLEMQSSGYNIYVSGLSGTGKTTIVKSIVNKMAEQNNIPEDLCYVYNFDERDCPNAMYLPAGEARKFKDDMKKFVTKLKADFKKQFNSKEYEEQRMEYINEVNNKKRDIMEELNEFAQKKGMQVHSTATGFHTVIIKDGKPLSPEGFEQLSSKERKEIDVKIRDIEIKITATMRKLMKLDDSLHDKLEKLNQQIAEYIVQVHIEECAIRYSEYEEVITFLKDVRKDIVINSDEFIEGPESEENGKPKLDFAKKYEINVIVDHGKSQGAPVIYESNPTYNNLFGRIEKKVHMGAYFTDFSMVRSGSLHRANGGYIIIDALNVLRNQFVYDSLKRAIKTRQLRIEDATELSGYLSASTLKPEPISLDVKVILLGSRYIYSILHSNDEDFTKIFKIRADFDHETVADDENIYKYAQFVKNVIHEEKLLPFSKTAIKEIILHSHRLISDQDKLSLQFNKIVSIIREADFWAKKENKKTVTDKQIKKAIEARKYRHNLSEEKIQEMIEKDIIKIKTDGERVGQINGLAVYSLGDYTFGKPHRLTARTFIGSENIIDIERKAKLGGKIHEKGVYILSGFFNAKFGEYIPLSFSGTIVFEQSYGMIDGDSASSTELFSIISSLSDLPIKQHFAVTGSVNQMGEIQAIGGVNEKIEGFFNICKSRGLNGEQGVIIPKSNVENLVLDEEVIKAVRNKKFNIYAIETVEDGIELLLGMKAGKRSKNGKFQPNTVYCRIEKKLTQFAMRSKEFKEMINKKKNE